MSVLLEARAIRKIASGRAVIFAMILALVLSVTLSTVLAPMVRGMTGFDPFDVQFPLTRETIAIQLGTYDATAARLYEIFAGVDFIFSIVNATFTALLWAWLFAKAPNRLYEALAARGILWVAFLPVLCDVAENIGLRMIIRRAIPLTSGIVEFSVIAHQAKLFALSLNNYITVVALTITAVLWIQAWRSRAAVQ